MRRCEFEPETEADGCAARQLVLPLFPPCPGESEDCPWPLATLTFPLPGASMFPLLAQVLDPRSTRTLSSALLSWSVRGDLPRICIRIGNSPSGFLASVRIFRA